MSKKVLIIEDEPIIMDILQKKIKNAGYDVFIARNGAEGLKTIRDLRPDIILLDIIMPMMSGLEVMEEIQKDPELKTIPVIVVSNSGQPVEIDRVKKLGARDWLIKTEFDPQEVIEKIKNQLGE